MRELWGELLWFSDIRQLVGARRLQEHLIFFFSLLPLTFAIMFLKGVYVHEKSIIT